MAYVGSAYLDVVPKIRGLSSAVSSAMANAESSATAGGKKVGNAATSGLTSAFAKTGVVAGAFSSITTQAMNAVANSLSGAISRFDALNNYPTVMTALGYSAVEASNSINTMSDRLQGLPIALNDMTSTVQGIVAVTGDLDEATNVGLALNDMLLAGGASTQLAASAMEQFRQILAKGKPEMQDWRTLTSAMPGQMKQLSESMLGAGATADDLYKALGGGGAEATITMQELMQAMIKLDQEGGSGITSFADQAKSASGGIATAMDNINNAMNRGMASVFDAVGKETITSTLEDVRVGINEAFKVAASVVSQVMPVVKSLTSVFKENFTTILTGVVAYKSLSVGANVAMSAFGSVSGTLKNVTDAFKLAKGGAGTLTEAFKACSLSISPVSLAITAVTAAVGVGVALWQQHTERMQKAEKATTGLVEACNRGSSLKSFSGQVQDIGTNAQSTSKSLKDSIEIIGGYTDKINEANAEAESQISILNSAQSVIQTYSGQTDLSAEAQGKVRWACSQLNEQLGLNIDSTNVLNNSYVDQDGNVQTLTASIDKLIQKKKEEIQLSTYEDQYTNALKAKQEAQDAYVNGIEDYNKLIDNRTKQYMREGGTGGLSYEDFRAKVEKSYKDANPDNVVSTLERANQAYEIAAKNLGAVEQAASGAGDAYSQLASKITGTLAESWLKNKSISIQDLTDELKGLGADTSKLASLQEDEWARIAQAYDGTANSIIPTLKELGVSLGEVSVAGGSTAEELKQAFESMGEDVKQALDGIDMDDFTEKLSVAGVSTETLNQIGSDNLRQLAENCNGDVNKMIAYISLYNSVPLVDKNGNVNVNDAPLIDAQGHLYTYNGSTLYDKTANVEVNDAEVIDAYGNVWLWNGQELISKDGYAKVSGNGVDGTGKDGVNDTSSAISNLYGKEISVDVWGNFTSAVDTIWNLVSGIGQLAGKAISVAVSGNAAGGIRKNAAGGYRFHANGAIATRAVPLDIVGEDGAEAIVPLTNKRYSLPFAQTIAEQMQKSTNENETSRVLAAISTLAAAMENQEMAIYVDSKKLASSIARPMNQQLGMMSRRGI